MKTISILTQKGENLFILAGYDKLEEELKNYKRNDLKNSNTRK